MVKYGEDLLGVPLLEPFIVLLNQLLSIYLYCCVLLSHWTCVIGVQTKPSGHMAAHSGLVSTFLIRSLVSAGLVIAATAKATVAAQNRSTNHLGIEIMTMATLRLGRCWVRCWDQRLAEGQRA